MNTAKALNIENKLLEVCQTEEARVARVTLANKTPLPSHVPQPYACHISTFEILRLMQSGSPSDDAVNKVVDWMTAGLRSTVKIAVKDFESRTPVWGREKFLLATPVLGTGYGGGGQNTPLISFFWSVFFCCILNTIHCCGSDSSGNHWTHLGITVTRNGKIDQRTRLGHCSCLC